MTTTYTEAVNQMFALIKTAIDNNAASIIGYPPEIRWQGVQEETAPDASKYWLRVSQQTVNEAQSTLRDDNGVRRYGTVGFVLVQLFCAKSDVEVMTKGRALAIIARDAYRGEATPDKVWFRNARINELPPDSDSIKFNIVSDYEYDEVN